MKQLQRPAAPTALGHYRAGINAWNSMDKDHSTEVNAALDTMQAQLCAFCEGALNSLGRHIEHRCRRHTHPKLTFAWANLFASCNRNDSCGHFKDSKRAPAYDCHDLIDPSAEDPDAFLVIRDNGRIEPCPNLSPSDRQRAEITIAVYNLNLDGPRSLVAERRRVLALYLSREPDILDFLAESPPAERDVFIADELDASANDAFSSIIRHFLTQAA